MMLVALCLVQWPTSILLADNVAVTLPGVTFNGDAVEMIVPSELNDIYNTHAFAGALEAANNLVVVSYLPLEEDGIILMILFKQDCPEAVALEAYDMKVQKSKYYIYKAGGIPKQVESEVYTKFIMEKDHICSDEDTSSTDNVGI
jgi:hypothetical protein